MASEPSEDLVARLGPFCGSIYINGDATNSQVQFQEQARLLFSKDLVANFCFTRKPSQGICKIYVTSQPNMGYLQKTTIIKQDRSSRPFIAEDLTIPETAGTKILTCVLQPNSQFGGYYRLLVDGKQIKYLTTAPDAFLLPGEDDAKSEPILVSEFLPKLPVNSWNRVHLVRDKDTGEVTVETILTQNLPGIDRAWHPKKLNETDFTEQKRLRSYLHVSTHPDINDNKPVLVSLANWPWDVMDMEDETVGYHIVSQDGLNTSGVSIAPRFFGHVLEADGTSGRIIGFATEYFEGARRPGPDDLDSCQRVLSKLHSLGRLWLGYANKSNFLIREDRDPGDDDKAMLVNLARIEPEDSGARHDEMDELEERLNDSD